MACSRLKADHPLPARDLYVSPLFRAASTFADRHYATWFILSAKHGLVEPSAILAPYELSLRAMPARERQVWGGRIAQSLMDRFPPNAVLLLHAGALYCDVFLPLIPHQHRCPLAHLSIGQQLEWYRRHS